MSEVSDARALHQGKGGVNWSYSKDGQRSSPVALQEKGLGIAEALADKGMTIVIVGRIGEKGVRRADGCQGS